MTSSAVSTGVVPSYFAFDFEIPTNFLVAYGDFGVAGITSTVIRDLVLKAVFGPSVTPKATANTAMAFWLITGSTAHAKQLRRMTQVIAPIVIKYNLQSEIQRVVNLINEPLQSIRVTESRLASAFPDFAASLRAVNSETFLETISWRGRTTPVTYPAILNFPQSLQLDLDDNMQRIANEMNRHYWLSVVTTSAEVEDCGDFIFSYFDTATKDKYKLLFFKDICDDKTTIDKHFPAPYSGVTLLKYMILMQEYFKGNRKINDVTLTAIETNADFVRSVAGITNITTWAQITADERRDAKAVKFSSTTSEYLEEKAKKGRSISNTPRTYSLLKSTATTATAAAAITF